MPEWVCKEETTGRAQILDSEPQIGETVVVPGASLVTALCESDTEKATVEKKKNSHMTWQFARRHVKSVRRFCSLRGKSGFLSIINTLRHPQSESWWCQHHTVGGLLRSGKIFKGEINADRLWRRFTDKNFKKSTMLMPRSQSTSQSKPELVAEF